MTIHIEGGYAARRPNGCLANENKAEAWQPRYWACCPDGQYATRNTEDNGNFFCKGTEATANDIPRLCTNSTWTLYYNTGFFCCDQGMIAYLAESKNADSTDATFGCDSQAYVNQQIHNHSDWSIQPLKPYTSPDKSSGPNKGAIAGGVVGGVCGAIIILGLVWFLLRRRSRSKVSNNAPGGSVATTSDTPSLSKYGHQPFEIEGGNKPMGELYDPASMQTELEANKQARHELSSNIPKKVRQGPPSELP